jgi:hypothetical protein
MIGICSILAADASVDPVKYFNRAFEHYSKARGQSNRMFATRVMMDAAAFQAATGRYAAGRGATMHSACPECLLTVLSLRQHGMISTSFLLRCMAA